MKRYAFIIAGIYLFFAVVMDHILFGISLRHTMLDPWNLLFPTLMGLGIGWFFGPKR